MFKKEPVERVVELGGIQHICKIKHSKRSRRLAIHVDVWKGIQVVIPRWVSAAAAVRFVKEKERWVLDQLDYATKLRADMPRRKLINGESIVVFGNTYTLVISRQPKRKRARVIQIGNEINIYLPPGAVVRTALTHWCREQARNYFMQKSQDLARTLGVTVTNVAIGDHKSQWGSAGARGRLSFNWRLLLASQNIADYVAAHEVAHLLHHNHSANFWLTVALLDPDYKTHRAWLKSHGHSLVL
jgi:predicted metal-dependent hydrolase